MKIVKASINHLEDCLEIVTKSELGTAYFTNQEQAYDRLKGGIEKGEVHVALNDNQEVLGFAWICPTGMFAKFPYLRTIAVKEELRGKGLGKKLLHFFEQQHASSTDQVYLLVSDFNKKAKKLYESVGYKEIGFIKDWVVEGISEHIMMKRLKG